MSTTTADTRTRWRDDPQAVAVFRFAFAVTLAMGLAQGINWPISFLHPVLVAALLGMPAPSLRDSLFHAGYAIVALLVCVVFALFFLAFPAAFAIAYPLLVFLTIYALFKGVHFLFCLFMIIGLVIMPQVGLIHDILSMVVAGSIVFSALLSVAVVQLAFGLLPAPPGSSSFGMSLPVYHPGYSADAARTALAATLVLAPAAIAFLTLRWTAQVVVLVYMFIIAVSGNLAKSQYAAQKYLKANAVGALGALIFYLFLVVVPEFHFLLGLTLFTALLFGAKIFSDDPYAAYYSSAFTGLIILVSSSMGPGADVGVNALVRVFYVFVAGVYVILALPLGERLAARLIPDRPN